MASTPASFCPQCGAPLQGGSRFCTNCGTTIGSHANSPTMASSQIPIAPPAGMARPDQPGVPGQGAPLAETAFASPSPNAGSGSQGYPNSELLPPPPPPPTFNPYTNSGPGAQSYAQTTIPNTYHPQSVVTPPPMVPPPLSQAGAYQVPAYAQKQKGNRGCAIISILLLIVLVAAGVGGFFFLRSRGNTNGGITPTSSSTNSGNTGTTPTSASGTAKTVQINLQFTFASITITLVSAQLSQNFPDDPNTSAGPAGIVRVNLRENNSTTRNPNYLEGDTLLLLLPGNTTTQASNEHEPISPDAGVNRLNWIDFQLNSHVGLNQLTLRVGAQSQSQFDIPFQANADLSKYQDKTSNPGAQFKYGALNMTLKTAVLSYSYSDQQATTGNRYMILTLAAVNNSSDSIAIYPGSYMRMQVGGNSVEPDNTYTVPLTVNPNTSASGVVAFLVPQDTTSFTFVMLAQPGFTPAINQVTQNFQVQ